MVLKTVTLQEANGLLPYVCERFLHIHVLLAKLTQMRYKINKKNPKFYGFKNNIADILIVKKRPTALGRDIKILERALEEELSLLLRFGVVIKSIFPPHIDFLSIKNNELIYLCWHASEPNICHWHAIDDGPANRYRIQQKELFGPEVVH